MSGDDGDSVPFIEVKNPDERWSQPIFAGWMNKFTRAVFKISVGKGFWERRFFILDKINGLFYFKKETSKKPQKDPVKINGVSFWKSMMRRNCIEIQRDQKRFLMAGKDNDDVTKWIHVLTQAGGIFEPNGVFGEDPMIAKVAPKKWDNDHVNEFLSFVKISPKDSFASKYPNSFLGFDGKTLMNLNESQMKDIGVESRLDRIILKKTIDQLKTKTQKAFSLGYHIVTKKIFEMCESRGVQIKASQRHGLSATLSDPEAMCQSYLTVESLKKLIEERESFFSRKKKGQNEDSNRLTTEEEEEEEEEGEDIDWEEFVRTNDTTDFTSDSIIPSNPESGNGSDRGYYLSERPKFPVKLILTEVTDSTRDKNLRKIFSPILSKSEKYGSQFGMYHSALLIGPWYFEWTDSSLIIPRRASSGKALISADVPSYFIYREMDETKMRELSRKIANVVCMWNTKKFYRKTNSTRLPQFGNCQDFVTDLMNTLGITTAKNNALANFLDRMRVKGIGEMIFAPSEEFREEFKLEWKEKVFETHRELDEYCKQLILDKMDIQDAYTGEWGLLKSFDRAFWLRHIKDPEDERYKPLPPDDPIGEDFETGCVFSDPRATKSFL